MKLSNITAVAWRDFIAVVRTKGFVIGLLFMPGLILLMSQMEKILDRFGERGERRYVFVDFTGKLAGPISEKIAEVNQKKDSKLTIALEFADPPASEGSGQDFVATSESLRLELGERVSSKELFGYVIIGPRALEIPPPPDQTAPASNEESAVVYGASSLTAGDLKKEVRDAISMSIRGERLASQGVDRSLAGRIDKGIELKEFIVSKEGKKGGEQSEGTKEVLIPLILVVLLLMGVMQSAGMLLTSTIEEKSNRVVEVLVSSISPFELLAGKVVGAWLTGAVMLVAWGGAGAYTAEQFQLLRSGILSPLNLVWFTYFFFVGYLLFASLYAAIGAMCSSIQDAQNMMMPVVILIIIPMAALSFVLNQPNSGLSVALTWFPFSAPFIAVLRIAASPPAPQWQIAIGALSVGLTALFMMWLGGKIFRAAILMTGKPPKPSELWRMLRAA